MKIKLLIFIALALASTEGYAYPWMSPYAYCMGNPVKFIDPDGRKVVNAKGVNIFYINASNQLSLSNVASENERMVFNGMMLTNTGQRILRQMITSPTSIDLQFEEKCPRDDEHHIIYAETKQFKEGADNGITKDKNGMFRIKYATITFFMETIKESLSYESDQNYGLSLVEAVGAEATHEGVHASDKDEIHKDIASKNGGPHRTKNDSEKKPRETEQQFRDELKQK